MNYSNYTCPACGAQMAPIIYGYPSTQLVELAQQDIIALGGTKYDPNDHSTHYCYSCHSEAQVN